MAVYSILLLAIAGVLVSYRFMPNSSGDAASISLWFATASCLLAIVWIIITVACHSHRPPRTGLHIDEVRIPQGLHTFGLLAMVITGLASISLSMVHVVVSFESGASPSACVHTASGVFAISKTLFMIVLGLFIGKYISPGHVLHRSWLNTVMLAHTVCTLIVVLSADYVNETRYKYNIPLDDNNNNTESDNVHGDLMYTNCTSKTFGRVLHHVLPYLMPCYSQYALIAAALLIDMWMRSSRFSFSHDASTPVQSHTQLTDSDEASPLLWSLTTHGTFRSPTSSRFHYMPMTGTLAMGLLASIVLASTMVLLAVFVRNEGTSTSHQLMDNLLYYPYRMLLLVLMMIASTLGLRTLSGAKPIRGSLTVQEVMVLIGLCAEAILSGFTITAWSMKRTGDIDDQSHHSRSPDSYPMPAALVVTDNIVRLLQAFLQVKVPLFTPVG